MRIGSLVLLDLYAVTPVDLAQNLGSIPSGYRPAGSCLVGSNGLYASGARLIAYTNGTLGQISTTAGVAIYAHASWRTTDPLPTP